MSDLEIRKTPLALADISQISDWLFERSGSVDVVLRWLDDLESRFHDIAKVPGTGTLRPEWEPGLRTSPFGNYLIVFHSDERAIRIVRVLHGGRDLSQGIQLH